MSACAHQKIEIGAGQMVVCKADRHEEVECMDFDEFMGRFLPAIGCSPVLDDDHTTQR